MPDPGGAPPAYPWVQHVFQEWPDGPGERSGYVAFLVDGAVYRLRAGQAWTGGPGDWEPLPPVPGTQARDDYDRKRTQEARAAARAQKRAAEELASSTQAPQLPLEDPRAREGKGAARPPHKNSGTEGPA